MMFNGKIVDIRKYKIMEIHKKYNELKQKMNKYEEQKLNLSLTIAKIDKVIFTIKQDMEKIEQEILKEIK